jgi:peptide-methionine (S)-S-oxide reductase
MLFNNDQIVLILFNSKLLYMKAIFGAGCFWHVEDLFSKTTGVKSTQVGYIGGKLANPTYEEVCTDKTGHIEAVEVEYDPKEISYDELLKIFWNNHDPTSLHRQGPDVGVQYSSAIFFYDEEQKKAAQRSKDELEKSRKFQKTIVTEIIPAPKFYKAEEYHQKYFQKHGLS